jgi:hypothetical protein
MENNLAIKLLNTNGKIVTVTFTKKDGSIRVMNCRLGVTKHLKGGESKLNSDKYITVYDLKSEGYRAIAKDQILAIKGV